MTRLDLTAMQFFNDPYTEIDPDLQARFDSDISQEKLPVDLSSVFNRYVELGNVKRIGAGCFFENGVKIGDDAVIGDGVHIDERSYIGKGVIIGSLVNIGPKNFFSDGSGVSGSPQSKTHSFMRSSEGSVVVGPGVFLPTEFQLGPGAVIPTPDSIVQIGRFGTAKRMVTIYGSDQGPLFGVACQYGITTEKFKRRIANGDGTTPESAQDYADKFSKIEAAAALVQTAYEREANLVSELREIASEAIGDIVGIPPTPIPYTSDYA